MYSMWLGVWCCVNVVFEVVQVYFDVVCCVVVLYFTWFGVFCGSAVCDGGVVYMTWFDSPALLANTMLTTGPAIS